MHPPCLPVGYSDVSVKYEWNQLLSQRRRVFIVNAMKTILLLALALMAIGFNNGCLAGRPVDVVKEAINKRFEEFYCQSHGENTYSPYVCVSCDLAIKPKQVRWITDKTLKQNARYLREQNYSKLDNDNLRQCYLWPDRKKGHRRFMDNLLLSPRATFRMSPRKGYSCCAKCANALHSKRAPDGTVSNSNFFGKAPKILEELTLVELSQLCTARTFGYCFTFQGGRAMTLKGTLGYYRVSPEDIAQSVAFLDSLGANVVVLITGKMTAAQRAKAREYGTLRVDKLYEAVKWLIQNHVGWKGVDLEQWRAHFEARTVHCIDESYLEEPSDVEAEKETEKLERFCVYYPDGQISEATGGQDSPEKWLEMVATAKEKGFNLDYMCQLEREYILDETKGNAFVMSSLLQFPYG